MWSSITTDPIASFQSDISIFMSLYFILLLLFLIIKCIIDLNSKINYDYSNSSIIFIYITFLSIFTAFFIFIACLKFTRNELVCGKINFNTATYSFIIPYIIIYFTGVVLLFFFPGWIRGFSNTYGSSISKYISGLQEIATINDNPTESNKQFLKNFYMDPTRLFNELRIDNVKYDYEKDIFEWNDLEEIINTLESDDTTIRDRYRTTEFRKTLYNYIVIKNNIGSSIWIYILGTVTLLTSVTHILSNSCSNTVEDDDEFQKSIIKKLSN